MRGQIKIVFGVVAVWITLSAILSIIFYLLFYDGLTVEEPYECREEYHDAVFGSDIHRSFGDGRFCLMHGSGDYEGYMLFDRKTSTVLAAHVVKGRQRRNIIRVWDKDGREHILDFLALTLDGRCIECGKIHLGGVCPAREIMYYSDSTN